MSALSTITRPTDAADRQTLWMKRSLDDVHALEALLRPETDLERYLLTEPDFRRGLLWGEPRFGHPEGKVGLHVREVLDNIDAIPDLPCEQRRQLRLITLVHDTFKYAEDRSHPRNWDLHHGRLARLFLEPFVNDHTVLDIVETHDDAYYAWLAQKHEQFSREHPHKSLDTLLSRIDYCLQLYYLFFKCDTQTGDKTQAPLKWFERTVPGIRVVPVNESV